MENENGAAGTGRGDFGLVTLLRILSRGKVVDMGLERKA
jgi:hypothetical protein